MNIESMLSELKKVLPPESFKIQPYTALRELEGFESTYGISTARLLDGNELGLEQDIVDRWLETYEIYLLFSKE
jgi:hypothetical protein